MRTGFKQGPRDTRLVAIDGGKMNFDFNKGLRQAIQDSVEAATWLTDADEASVITALLLADTIQEEPSRRHQLTPILIGLLNNMGLISGGRNNDEVQTPESWLESIKNG